MTDLPKPLRLTRPRTGNGPRRTALRVIVVVQVKEKMSYSKSFKLYQDGKRMNPDALTVVSDSGEGMQPTQRQIEG